MIAVGWVTKNRVNSPIFPNTYCDVVYEAEMTESWKTKQYSNIQPTERIYYPKRDRCQFSWYCDGLPDEIPSYDRDVYNVALLLSASIIRSNTILDNTYGATHYHADYVTPKWSKTFKEVTKIGRHIFYRFQ